MGTINLDLGLSGQWYTWERGRLASNNIRERLDRGLPMRNDGIGFPIFLYAIYSIVFHIIARFEEQVQRNWTSNTQDVLVKLNEIGLGVKCWAQKEKRLRGRRIEELNVRLFDLGNGGICDAVLEEMTEIKLHLNLEADKEELFWEQRARTNWLRMGDRNTVFFHRSATGRKKKNMVKKLESDDGNVVTDFDGISKIATDYFNELFSSKESGDCERLFASFSPCISEELNKELMAEFKE
ncbi:uncharacterized protein [Gossypium hirsutum]|uniref:Reverse transcriptase n=1 Tax=Gossypium hirsutum TaxID=3635 RepID=A0ABM2Z4A5_GOSHI|nr:uncharacterized protein LOC121209851 [Gossypium hirsutum]